MKYIHRKYSDNTAVTKLLENIWNTVWNIVWNTKGGKS